MKKLRHRLTIRFPEDQLDILRRRAQKAGITPTDYVRALVSQDLNTGTDAVVNRLGRQILFTSIALHRLLIELGKEELLPQIESEAERLSGRLDLLVPLRNMSKFP